MKPLIIGAWRVGENVTFRCSEWNTWMNVESNDKYFCNSPCTEDKHIIIKAAFGETKHNNRIKLTNRAKGLVVTFSNLQKSDSKTYYCGVVRFAHDSFIMRNLSAESSSPKTTPETVIDGSTPSFAVSNSSHESLSSSEMITDMARSYMTTTPTASATQGAGSVPYVIIGVTVIITILMVLLKLMRKMSMKQLKFVSSADTPKEDVPESAGPDGVYQSLHPLTMDIDQVYSILTPTRHSTRLCHNIQ
ncbi:uncharacterized protein LOC120556991 [Perca fluviatilis]|uniref:uncharacterized protein LOC120556991 n=1 Tax=Perca fluviatilis TaxID=8168 RepID=UPI001964D2B9|nr:uncharacterized protein LOC120556991 [Perca fluviatilis]